MSAQHTPGPWAFMSDCGEVQHADGDVRPLIATVEYDNTGDEQYLADGRLIAAAPELLAQAQLFARCIEYEIRKSRADGDDEGARLKTLTLRTLNEVIANATGQ